MNNKIRLEVNGIQITIKVDKVKAAKVKKTKPLKVIPKDGTVYYSPCPIAKSGYFSFTWEDSPFDKLQFEQGLCFSTSDKALSYGIDKGMIDMNAERAEYIRKTNGKK